MPKHLVLAGGGHAHMVALANLYRITGLGHKVTVIGPSRHHYYSGMGPGMLGQAYTPEQIRFATQRVVEKQGGQFVLGKIERIDPIDQSVQLSSGERVPYDVISFNVGSHVPQSEISENAQDIYLAKPIEKLLEAQQRILALAARQRIAIGIVGGGPSAVEIAGNVWRLTDCNDCCGAVIQIFTQEHLLPSHPAGIRRRALRSLKHRGIEVLEGSKVTDIRSGRIELASGQAYHLDIIFVAVGVKPSSIFATSGLPVGPDGGLRVNQFLQSTAYPNIFGGGDCIHFEEQPLDKVGVYAVRQNPILYHNLEASMEELPLKSFSPGGDYLLIFNLGDGTGILRKKWLQLSGKPAFWIKDYIDRKFMREFQSIEA